ncbi:p53-induced death domain-containing protein 1 [Pelobates fuscus]|uniref:p53-induced death domain-containing protein 1 n=1 Tax=Pelobates fuscus TaxID=191477 RepID=UPI002FE49AAB
MDSQWVGTSTEEPLSPSSPIAGDRLVLEYRSDGCECFLQLTEAKRGDLEQVEILHLSSNNAQISQAVGALHVLHELRVLVLKGGLARDELGRCQHGLLTSLPSELCNLKRLTYLDLSYNSFTELPSCITFLTSLSELHLSCNHLRTLPEDISNLVNLTYLSVMFNQLTEIPAAIGQLRKLDKLYLSGNKLESLPEEIGCLKVCTELDLSDNCLTGVPETLCHMTFLKQLILQNNRLASISASLASLPDLCNLNLMYNSLRHVPQEILNCSCAHLKGNPIGEPESFPTIEDKIRSLEIKEIHLKREDDRFLIIPNGCRVYLPCGTEIYFPFGAVTSTITIYFQILPPDQQHVKLEHHDILLSRILELRPHGIQFHQDVDIAIPVNSPGSLKKREIVIRTLSGQTWTDLHTTTVKRSNEMQATCRTLHFSWFFVVSRLVEDHCEVPAEGNTLFSSVDNGIRVFFPPGATNDTRTVRMQVLPVSAKELKKITGDSNSLTSPLLCLSQSSTANFLNPVKIQLPLPPGVTGTGLDRSCLVLLHGDKQAQNWTDITSQVVLEITHIYARFEVDHFSWYWLWYTTKSYVGDLAKTVYKRLRMYQVHFVALQRKRDPEQVLLQCVTKSKVDNTVKKLKDRYKGPEPSDLVDLVEGEQFFAAFEQGLKLHSERPDCVSGRLSFIFYSRMKNMKEVYVTSSDRENSVVKGQVSFYRGSVPEALAEEITKHRKGPESEWMASLPIKLPKLKSSDTVLGKNRNSYSLPPLNLGNAEMGYLTESNLLSIARQIGREWRIIGMNLNLSHGELERIEYKSSGDLDKQILEMLFVWANKNSSQPDCVERLVKAMQDSGRTDIAEMIQQIVTLGKQKYTQSIRRLGLDRGNSSEDSAIALSQ